MPIVIDGNGNETHIPRQPEGRVIDLGDGCSIYRSNKMLSEKIGGVKSDDVTNKGDSSAFEQAIKDIPAIEYERYYRDIPKREKSGKIVVAEVDGVKQIVFEHRRGDVVLNSKGDPTIIVPGTIPVPRWFTREDRERPRLRYDDRVQYYRSLDGISSALDELSIDDLMALNTQVFDLISARHQGTVKQVVKSKYVPVNVVYAGGEVQVEVFDDSGNIIEALTGPEYDAKYGTSED